MLRQWQPQRPSYTGPADANIPSEINQQTFQSIRAFETQGVILPVNIIKSSIKVITLENGEELLVSGSLDCDTECSVEMKMTDDSSTILKEPMPPMNFTAGLSQAFKFIIPLSVLGPIRKLGLVISDARTDQQPPTKTRYPNPFYARQQMTDIELTFKEPSTGVDAKPYLFDARISDQYIMLREKRFVLLEIYGKPIQSSQSSAHDEARSTASSPVSVESDSLNSNDCIICLSAKKSTIVLPCRHMCLCFKCAETIKGRADKCPLCRQSFRALLHISHKEPNQPNHSSVAGNGTLG